MIGLLPLEGLYDSPLAAKPEPLPEKLAELYGPLVLPHRTDGPSIIANFVTTLDGVTSLNAPGHSGGGDISGFNEPDRMVMGLLRAVADAVVVGAGTLRAVPSHIWTAEHVYPALSTEYEALRVATGRSAPPVNVVVTASGDVDPDLPVFRSGKAPVLVVTTSKGAGRLRQRKPGPAVRIVEAGAQSKITAAAVLEAVGRVARPRLVLVEGGSQLLASFFAEGLLDELFLTLAPQVAGRDGGAERPGLVSGQTFAPERPVWGSLVSAKRAGSHLFLRYAFSWQAA
jgi:riboflavin biosynthesis pyrimidine reductase